MTTTDDAPTSIAASSHSRNSYRTPARAASARRLISQSDTGKLNRTRLLQILYDVGPLSRADLARIAGVAKTTIGSIVQPMVDEGILLEGEPMRSSAQGGNGCCTVWLAENSVAGDQH